MKRGYHIPKPCKESYDAMTPEAGGRHCDACDKFIPDFTRMSDAEVLAHFRKTRGKICGKISQSQLDRVNAMEERPSAAWKKVAAGLATLGLVGAVQAQTPAEELHPKEEWCPVAPPVQRDAEATQVQEVSERRFPAHSGDLRVRVIDGETGEPLAFATVVVMNDAPEKNGTHCGVDGLAILHNVPAGGTVVVNFMGYRTEEFILEAGQTEAEVELRAEEYDIVGIIIRKKRGPLGVIASPFRRLWYKIFH